MTLDRRNFLKTSLAGSLTLSLSRFGHAAALDEASAGIPVSLGKPYPKESLFAYIERVKGDFDQTFYRQILGAANPFKEGDEAIGVAAGSSDSRDIARQLLSHTTIEQITSHTIFEDELQLFIGEGERTRDPATSAMTLGDLKAFLLSADETVIKKVANTLSSDIIGCVVKLMSNDELIAVGSKVFNTLPGSQIGAKGYLGARVQPNSPTDNLDDIRWQVFDAWSYGVGDVLLGTNPVSSAPESVKAVELALQELLNAFQLEDHLPHCVLSHIDIQAEVEENAPGSTALWFQSIAGTDSANQTFDVSIEKMRQYARQRTGKYGLYFETGQGADFTNGHSHGFDMVLHESRKYGFARRLTQRVAEAQKSAKRIPAPWVHLNDVAGFIGPEVFRTREQLVRCCLEDIVMGKLHGITIGLDVCSTLHMEVSLEDLNWCLDQIMPANPAYLMALPTKIDPMLGYLTTGYQDHVRLRNKFGYRVNDAMQAFFVDLGVLDQKGEPTQHFGDPLWVYLKYQQAKGDQRSDAMIQNEGRQQIQEVRSRGVFIAEGYGEEPGDLKPELGQQIQRIYEDAKESLWTELSPGFISRIPDQLQLTTESVDREDYILHPTSGEKLSTKSIKQLRDLKQSQKGQYNVQIVISDGLNSLAISDPGHLDTFLSTIRKQLQQEGYRVAPTNLVITSGRVRAGYRIGETLYGGLSQQRAILHLIGERPGTGHHTFSVYMTAPTGETWNETGKTDHNITKVVSGIASTALIPEKGAHETVRLLREMISNG